MLKLVFVAGLIGYHAACRVLLGRLQRGGAAAERVRAAPVQ